MAGYNNLVLAGFMGTGKSTIGQLVADQLNLVFVETDTEIEAYAEQSITDIFATGGEDVFREIEAAVCLRAANGHDQVISTGGGALLNRDVYEAFSVRCLLVCLTCDLDEIIRRVGHDPARPLFAAERDRLARLLEARLPVYSSLPHQIDTTHRSPLQVTEEVICLWQKNI